MITKQIDAVTANELWSETTDGHIPGLLEIYNPDIHWGDGSFEQEDMYLRVINDTNAVRYKGKKYIPCGFSFKPPAEDGSKVGAGTITISNLDSRVQQMIGSIKIPSDVKVVAMFAKPNGNKYVFREISTWNFGMENANANRSTATFNLIIDDVYQLNVPRDTMDKNQLNSIVED